LRARLTTLWSGLSPRTKHWLINIAIGVVIILLLNWASNGLRLSFVINAQNAAFDRMMRASAAVAPEGHEGLPAPPKLVLVDIDDQTWRDPRWGGGEPSRAPRELLASLVEGAFQRGTSQVVLDVAIEGASGREQDLIEDRLFAARLEAMLAAPWFAADRQLVLVRTLRLPLPEQRRLLTEAGTEPAPFSEGYFDELRAAPAIDRVIAASAGRIVVAAPFFSVSPDRVLRDWHLLQVVCERGANPGEGRVRVVPSVQLAVAARHFGLPAGAAPWELAEPRETCTPFPNGAGANLAASKSRQAASALDTQADALIGSSWRNTHAAFARLGVHMSAQAPGTDDLGNRVVFRWARPPNVLSALELLQGQVRHELKGRTVLIGQTFPETVDSHLTPLGEMPGAVLLLNAIDSMTRHRIVAAPSVWMTAPLALAMIVVIGYAFSRWRSLLGTVIATCALLAVLPWISFSLFKHGVWLDFALPLLGIQVHKVITSLEESFARRKGADAGARPKGEPAALGLPHADQAETIVAKEGGPT
jgi:CHASE2 domain-containing sensor protein